MTGAGFKTGTAISAMAVFGLLLMGCSSTGDAATIYGDGEISCPDHRADDDALPVGTVEFMPAPGEIRVVVELTDAAPDWEYNVEVWSDESCATSQPLGGYDSVPSLTTDSDGAGNLDYVLEDVDPGTYMLNINVSSGDRVPDDLRHREMGATQFTEVVVP